MKFYSEQLKKFYDTEKECAEAEKDYTKALEEKERKHKEMNELRVQRAKEVEEAYKVLIDARKTYNQKLNDFCKDYGSYHMTIKGLEADPLQLFSHFFEF